MRGLTLEDCKIEARDRDGLCLSDSYKNVRTLMSWQCSKGHIWQARLQDIRSGTWCRQCSIINKRLTIDECHRLADTHGGKCLSLEVNNCQEKLTWQCKLDHSWTSTMISVKTGRWCKKCAYMSKRVPIERINEIIKDLCVIIIENEPMFEIKRYLCG